MLWILHLECDVFLSSLSAFPLNWKLRESGAWVCFVPCWLKAGTQYLLSEQMHPVTCSTIIVHCLRGTYHLSGETWVLRGTCETMTR